MKTVVIVSVMKKSEYSSTSMRCIKIKPNIILVQRMWKIQQSCKIESKSSGCYSIVFFFFSNLVLTSAIKIVYCSGTCIEIGANKSKCAHKLGGKKTLFCCWLLLYSFTQFRCSSNSGNVNEWMRFLSEMPPLVEIRQHCGRTVQASPLKTLTIVKLIEFNS